MAFLEELYLTNLTFAFFHLNMATFIRNYPVNQGAWHGWMNTKNKTQHLQLEQQGFLRQILQIPSSWWFQPIWEILVKFDHLPRSGRKYIWNHHLAFHPSDSLHVFLILRRCFWSCNPPVGWKPIGIMEARNWTPPTRNQCPPPKKNKQKVASLHLVSSPTLFFHLHSCVYTCTKLTYL